MSSVCGSSPKETFSGAAYPPCLVTLRRSDARISTQKSVIGVEWHAAHASFQTSSSFIAATRGDAGCSPEGRMVARRGSPDFWQCSRRKWHAPVMASPHESHAESVPASSVARQAPPALELEEELLRAEADFARGDFIELSREELDHCINTGESPWPDESRG
jgi:hypothetical protein